MAKRKGDQNSMSDVLKGFIETNRLQKGLDKVSIEDAWHKVMGKAISKYTTSISQRTSNITCYTTRFYFVFVAFF